MSTHPAKLLGIMRPLGGGDPIPLKKEELVIGRRPTTDICLDFENVSGKHCILKFVKGVWHVRDLGSTNGTTVNGTRIQSEHGLMPEDELGVATHLFTIDYEPIAPTSLLAANAVLEEEIAEVNKRQPSLLELAGLESDDKPRRRPARPERAPTERIVRPPTADTDFDDEIPDKFEAPKVVASDDDFFNMIQGDLGKDEPKKKS